MKRKEEGFRVVDKSLCAAEQFDSINIDGTLVFTEARCVGSRSITSWLCTLPLFAVPQDTDHSAVTKPVL